MAGCADTVGCHCLAGTWTLAHVSVDLGSLVTAETVVELRSVATSASRMAGLAVSEAVHVSSWLAGTCAGGLESSEGLALPTVVRVWTVTSVTRVVARLAVSVGVSVEAHVAHARTIGLEDGVLLA